ncbi:DUF2147 domain-containing protein [Gymnodinialimonas ulvae]|uniref:DUF2147 domain-containing protein n=1 Tax=Gymnodinialimonas ulvae TaxID=3126504 RepID=UPI0030AC81B0
MKRTLFGAVLALVCMAGGAMAQDPAHGVWQTEVDDGAYAHVTLAACGAAVCGTISRTFDPSGEYQSPNLGRQIVIDMVAQGGGAYEGSVWRPSNDRVYIGRMNVNGNTLTLRGCVAGGLLCARQTWARIQ